MKLPQDLIEEIKIFSFIIDKRQDLESVAIHADFAEILKPYSSRVRDKEYEEYSNSCTLFKIKTTKKKLDLYDFSTPELYGDEYFLRVIYNDILRSWGVFTTIILDIQTILYKTNYTVKQIFENTSVTRIIMLIEKKIGHSLSRSALPKSVTSAWLDYLIIAASGVHDTKIWKGDDLSPLFECEQDIDYINICNSEVDQIITIFENKVITINMHENPKLQPTINYYTVDDFDESKNIYLTDLPNTPEGFELLKMMNY